MKKVISTAIVFTVMMASVASVQANDKKVLLPISAAMNANDAKSRLGDSVKFYFGKQPGPVVLEKLGSDRSNLKTNAFGKSNEKACNWVFLSAMLQLQKRAIELGANAVVNIVSSYDNIDYANEAEFECHVGAVVAGVALKGDFVKIANK
ncbi:excinuclease ATPase subunit [Undibacterium sp. Ji83W]|uniref:excinuclease ATPase subunit n=1 Tax=Undibacterium sp. Ji83W TaxID=3413043 RepID=UPI003BF41A65